MHPQHLPFLNTEVLLPLRIHLQLSWRSTGPCRSWLLWFWTDMYFFGLRHVRWLWAICFLRCCLWCLTWWKKWQVKCVTHYLQCIICLSLPQLIRMSMLHLASDFHFVDVFSQSPFDPTRHPLWMIRITVLSGKNCIFFSIFPSLSSRLHFFHLLIIPMEMTHCSLELEVTQRSSHYSFQEFLCGRLQS